MGNRETIEAAAKLIRERSEDVQRVWAPPDWREIDIEYPAQVVVRLTPAGNDEASVEVFRWGDLLTSEVLSGYTSATALAELIEGVHRRALSR